ncbi:hypothetical protein IMSAGC018_00504 [Lachnospiraceae bacterium]|nr:hypothetical protein IMSAGC018_00504 [Lachnospiraceae bacterium]
MQNHSEDKAKRILAIYTRLRQGKIVHKAKMSETYGVSPRTIQRDIVDIQCFLQDQCMETGSIQEIVFDKKTGGYLMQTKQNYCLNEKAVLVVCRILLESRVLVKTELFPIIHSLAALCSDDSKVSAVKNMLQSGMEDYVEPEHGVELVNQIWNLENAVKGQRYIEIRYGNGMGSGSVVRKLKPMGVIIFKCRFYLVADIGEDTPANDKKDYGSKEGRNVGGEGQESRLFKIDEIQECIVMEERFKL